MATPSQPQLDAMAQAVIYKAVRFLKLPESPLGAWGEFSEYGVGVATVRPDHAIEEMLYGLRLRDWDVDLESLVTADDVIRVGLEMDPATFPADKLGDVERALSAAVSWVAHHLQQGVGIA